MEFSRPKFTQLPHARKHKNLAEFLEETYIKLLRDGSCDLESYNQLAGWLNLKPLRQDLKVIADRFHYHLKEAGHARKEHRLLPKREGDRSYGQDFLPIHIYLDNIRSAHNVGSILRTVEAFRLGSVYFSSEMMETDHKQILDAAMGAERFLHIGRCLLSELPRPYIGLETSPEAKPISRYPFPTTFTLVIGNEEYGLSDNTLTLVDALVEIPLVGAKNSLNVANAFAIAANHIRLTS